jgi:hypothetical protein
MIAIPQTAPAPISATLGPLFQIWLQPGPEPRCIPLLAKGEPYDACDALMNRVIDYEAGLSESESIFFIWASPWGVRPIGEAPDCLRP